MPKDNTKGTVVEKYLVEISPYFNNKKYDQIMTDLEKKISKGTKSNGKSLSSAKTTFTGALYKGGNGSTQMVKDLSKNMTTVADKSNIFNMSMLKTVGNMATIVTAFKTIYDIMNTIVTKASDFSNKMITASSAFINKDVRNLMARFGVSGQTATGIQAVTGLMGISVGDLKLMTPRQMELFSKLMSEWNKGMSSINPSAMEKYNKVLQNFQSEMASAKLELQIQLYKMLVSITPELEQAGNAIISLFKSLTKILQHPALKYSIKILSTALESLGDAIESLFAIIGYGWLWGGDDDVENSKASTSTNYTTNNVTVNAQSQNQFMGSNSTMFDLATNVAQNNSQIAQQQYLRTGRV